MKKLFLFILVPAVFMINTSCSDNESYDSEFAQKSNESLIEQISKITVSKGQRPQPPIWADCILYSGIVAPATFSPRSDSFDELYLMPKEIGEYPFKDGVPLISDSKPGDRDYNGGRWHLNVLKSDVDPAKYDMACKEEDLNLNDFMRTEMYFECPLRPRKN
jgi:hypothetical protein